MQFVRLMVFGFLALSVVYICVSFYSRSVRKERLEEEYDAASADGLSRDEFVAKGLAEYESGFRKKALVLIYVVPAIFIIAVAIWVN